MDNTVKLSVNNDLIVIRKFNDEYYTETLIKGYYSRKSSNKLFEWRLYGGEFKNVIAVTKKNVDGFDYYADVDGNLLHDNDGSIRLYEEKKPSEVLHSDSKLEQSISRSKRNILELAMCNDWDYFVTITGDSKKIDRYNVEDYKKRWKKLVHTYNKRPRNADYKIK